MLWDEATQAVSVRRASARALSTAHLNATRVSGVRRACGTPRLSSKSIAERGGRRGVSPRRGSARARCPRVAGAWGAPAPSGTPPDGSWPSVRSSWSSSADSCGAGVSRRPPGVELGIKRACSPVANRQHRLRGTGGAAASARRGCGDHGAAREAHPHAGARCRAPDDVPRAFRKSWPPPRAHASRVARGRRDAWVEHPPRNLAAKHGRGGAPSRARSCPDQRGCLLAHHPAPG